MPRTARTRRPAALFPPGFARSRPLHRWIRAGLLLFVVVNDLDAVRTVLASGGMGFGDRPFELLLLAVDLLLMVVLAVRPTWTVLPLAVLLALVYPLENPGSYMVVVPLVLAFTAYAAALPGFLAALAVFLVWQVAWAVDVSVVGPQFLWSYVPVTLVVTLPGLVLRSLSAQRALDRAALAAERERTERALERQRLELARELHDIIAHDLTVIAMQARSGAYSPDPAVMRETLGVVGDSSRRALRDLRRLLHVMRTDGDPDGPGEESGPAAADTGRDLEEVARRLREVGLPVSTHVEGELGRIPEGVRPTVQRVLREAATNVMKHAPAATSCALAVRVDDADVRVEVSNDAGPGAGLPASGFGLLGLRERVQLLGGELAAGPAGGGWRVSARIPLAPAPV
jgi:signal transduction histidine kinase